MPPAPAPLACTAPIRKIGVLYTVAVPAAVVRTLGGGPRVPVVVRCLGETYLSTVMPAGGGRGRIHVRADIFRPAGLGPGDKIAFTLEPDLSSREVALPADLQRALQFRPAAAAGWDVAPVSYRRAMVGYLEAARSPATRATRVEILTERLGERASRTARKRPVNFPPTHST
ncbi:MAG: YdeI/OmpD-associated family protein [Verrucomicrobiota bacterium]